MRSISGISSFNIPERSPEELLEVKKVAAELSKFGAKLSNLYCGGTRIAVIALPGFVVDEERREIEIYEPVQRDKVQRRSKKGHDS